MIFFLHGADSHRAREKLREIKAKYRVTYPSGEVRFFDCAETDIQEAKQALGGTSLFEPCSLLVFEHALGKSAFEELLLEHKELLGEQRGHIVVMFEPTALKEKRRSKLAAWLLQHAKHQEFVPLTPIKLRQWIDQEFGRYKLSCESRAKEVLVRIAGNNLSQLSHEIRKVASWKHSAEHKRVSAADVELLADARKEADIFSTIEAVAHKRKTQAFDLLSRHLQMGDSPIYLFGMLCYEFRTILQLRDALDRQLSSEAMRKKMKLHPYVFKKGLVIAQRSSASELKDMYRKLFALDTAVKTGRAELPAALELFIAQL